MKKFLLDMLKNPDDSYSTKRVAGWLLLLVSIIIGFIGIFSPTVSTVFEVVFVSLLAASMSSFGFSSFDTKSYFSSIRNNTSDQNN